ncbi:hypothetical protein F1737_09580 [Methanoplanus sp. FWC-SCC4]|uniref:CARDB domain-containing protein n=1 Tax=Methanochimaera problematica TaxID=2609417 RepID=A0AA97I3P5_9EURY|nr:CARDB domain-containing protein [Methanoplanus sp. FWC-SCC4]WOF16918.1 hypothetical protein F1737_09580 [Methanoplanus sp. FWC-SCC4]
MRTLYITTIIGLFFAAVLANPVYAGEATVIVTDTSITPDVLMPGDKALIYVTLKNTATSATLTKTEPQTSLVTDINPTIQSVFLDGRKEIKVLEGNSQFSGDIGPGQTIKLTFLIEAGEKEGIFFPTLRVGVKGAESVSYPIPVNVNTQIATAKKPAIIFDQTPGKVVNPGDEINIVLNVSNQGKSTAEDITIKLSPEESSVAAKNQGTYYINSLYPGESRTLFVDLISDREAEPKIHTIPLKVTYITSGGEEKTELSGINIDIKGKAEPGIASVKTDPSRISKGDDFDLTIRIENTGTGEAKSTAAMIDLPLLGTREAFVGKIKAGNDAPAVFILNANKAGDFEYKLKVTYTDDTGEYEKDYTLHLNVSENDNTAGILIVLIVICAGGYLGYRYLRQKKEE